jgi:hypothetical protein
MSPRKAVGIDEHQASASARRAPVSLSHSSKSSTAILGCCSSSLALVSATSGRGSLPWRSDALAARSRWIVRLSGRDWLGGCEPNGGASPRRARSDRAGRPVQPWLPRRPAGSEHVVEHLGRTALDIASATLAGDLPGSCRSVDGW